MKRNVEIKARAADPAGIRRRAGELAGGPPEILEQDDTFFQCDHGRLKLRVLSEESAELIWYERPDTEEPSQSSYVVYPSTDPGTLRQALSRALEVRGRVRKIRALFLAGNTRIHLDEVEGLGSFVELEVVLGEHETFADGERVAREIMEALEIRQEDLLDRAYVDMLSERGS
jgi:predicted adenylyl cyclase CyaB